MNDLYKLKKSLYRSFIQKRVWNLLNDHYTVKFRFIETVIGISF